MAGRIEMAGAPFLGTEADWADCFARLRRPLPDDYVTFVSTYGPGCLRDRVNVFAPWPDGFLVDEVESALEGLGEDPGASWKEGAMIFFGTTTDGSVLYWKATGPAPTWRVWVGDGDDLVPTGLSFDGLVAAVMSGTSVPRVVPDDMTAKEVSTYEPIHEHDL